MGSIAANQLIEMASEQHFIIRSLRIACKKEIVITSLKVALVVGILLNLINQWEAIITLDVNKINWAKLLLTFCVPYLVSTYASVVIYLRNSA